MKKKHPAKFFICYATLITLMLLTSVGVGVFAFADESTLNIENYFANRIQHIIRKLDLNAKVELSLVTETKDIKLPGTPFSLQPAHLTPLNTNLKIKEATVYISTVLKELSPEIQTEIEQEFKTYGVTPKIQLQKHSLPMNEILEEIATVIKRYVFVIIATMLGTLFAIGIIAISLRKKGSEFEKLDQSIRESASQLTASIEAAQYVQSSTTNQTQSQNDSDPLSLSSQSPEQFQIDKEFIRGLTAPSLLTLLSDAYWCQQDSYAAYVVSLLTTEMRMTLLEKSNYFKSYLPYLLTVAPTPASYHFDPSYYQPLTYLNSFDNQTLTKLVRKYTQLWENLSKLRQNSLQLYALEKLRILESSSGLKKGEIISQKEISEFKPSTQRLLESDHLLMIKDFDEEEQILSDKSLDLKTKAKLPSLGWLLEIPKDDAKGILQSYNAQQLSSVWLAPPSVIETLNALLPEKKKNLVLSYLETVRPQRNHPIYIEIHKQAIRRLESESHETKAA